MSYASYLTPSTNLQLLKDQVKKYHESGAYNFDLEQISDKAKTYLAQVITKNKTLEEPQKLAIVLDIDETALSGYKYLKKYGFGGTSEMYGKSFLNADSPAIKPTLDLYKYAINNNVTVFFITGRAEEYRNATVENLSKVGYVTAKEQIKNCESQPFSGDCTVYLRDKPYLHISAIIYKTEMRKRIEEAGYTIVENIGDQYSDLDGGYSLRTFKYPNYMYYVP